EESHQPTSRLPLDLQQQLLNIFKDAFPETLGPNIKPLLQEVKQHLYNRDFVKAFGRDDYLETYAVRWSPSRALGYLDVFDQLADYIMPTQEPASQDCQTSHKLVCLGGGAGAEIVALAGFCKLLDERTSRDKNADTDSEEATSASERPSPRSHHFELLAIDIANWATVVDKLQCRVTNPPVLSKYASAAAKESNVELLSPKVFQTTFVQSDVLAMEPADLSASVQDADVITLLFTLNELYTTSLPRTQAFLLRLTEALRAGSLLLVVDSPGSYSTITLNGAERKYPMHWLLDHTLLAEPKRGEPGALSWEKVMTDESKWFRLPPGLKYPIELENMRYQVHLYRRL
ncbi:hypothetical protein K490DRAFT_5953, partial [Saccharata proteae CBS 121410]